MTNLELLWEYQVADIAVDKMQAEIKRSPVRQKLIKYRDSQLEQQAIYKRIEQEVEIMADRLDALKDALSKAEAQCKAFQEKIETASPDSLDDVHKLISDAKKLKDNVTSLEQEISKIKKDAADRERQQHDVKMRYAKFKSEFTALKETYDAEYSKNMEELEKLKNAAKEKAKDVDQALMEKYQQIKKHSFPPLSKLSADKCGGCNMSLPSGAVRAIKGGDFIECETCGRLVML